MEPRYVKKDRRIYDFSSCQACGTCWGSRPGCEAVACMACGVVQCMGNGPSCAICYRGLLPNWSGTTRPCGYKGCKQQAISRAQRVGYVCGEHATRAKAHKTSTIAEGIQEALQNLAKTWELWTQ